MPPSPTRGRDDRQELDPLEQRMPRVERLLQHALIEFQPAQLTIDVEPRVLYRASQAGVRIDMIVSGVCCLRPGIAGVSDNIRVRSIVGRFLEHSRLYYFENGGDSDLLVRSADLMERNLDRRIEALVFVRDPRIKQHLRHTALDTLLADNDRGMELGTDGSYTTAEVLPCTPSISAQEEILRQYTTSAS